MRGGLLREVVSHGGSTVAWFFHQIILQKDFTMKCENVIEMQETALIIA